MINKHLYSPEHLYRVTERFIKDPCTHGDLGDLTSLLTLRRGQLLSAGPSPHCLSFVCLTAMDLEVFGTILLLNALIHPSISWVLLQAAVNIYRNPSQLEYKMVN